MTVTMKEYWEDKQRFFKKHPIMSIITSNMDEYGCWHKVYICEGNHELTECYTPTIESGIAVIRGVEVKTEVKMLRTEYYSTEFGSKYTYEKY